MPIVSLTGRLMMAEHLRETHLLLVAGQSWAGCCRLYPYNTMMESSSSELIDNLLLSTKDRLASMIPSP